MNDFFKSKAFAVAMFLLALVYSFLILGARDLAPGPKTMALIFGIFITVDAYERIARAWKNNP